MIELEILDQILKQLKDKTEDTPLTKEEIHWYAGHLFTSNPRNRRAVMDKLVNDKFAGRIVTNIDRYFITYDGLIFINKGGYSRQFVLQRLRKIVDYVNIIVVILGSIIAAIYAIFEIFDWSLYPLVSFCNADAAIMSLNLKNFLELL